LAFPRNFVCQKGVWWEHSS